MPFIRTEDSNVRTFDNHEGETRYIHEYFGKCDEIHPGPQGFLVEMPEDNIGQSHFHGTDQFQVFFADKTEDALFQKRPMLPVNIHYSDAYTTYGPFTSGSAGISFFTLRARASEITAYMPEERNRRKGRPGRNITVSAGVEDHDTSGPSGITPIIEGHDDGLAAFLITVEHGASVQGPPAAGSEGQYYCVISGEPTIGAVRLPEKSLGWISPEDEAPIVEAQGCNACVAVMQFPQCGTRRQE